MSKRYTQAERTLYALVNGRPFINGRKGLEVMYEEVFYNGTKVGYILNDQIASRNDEYYDHDYEDYIPYTYLLLTLQDYMLPERVRKALVIEANKNEMLVVFKPAIDIGFGLNESELLSAKELKKTLLKVAKYSQDDIKTAALVGNGYYSPLQNLYSPIWYTCNQILEGHSDKFHAEQILSECLMFTDNKDPLFWLMDLEPCEDCLRSMMDYNTQVINYITRHKEKWDTPAYIQLVNDIQTKRTRNGRGFPVIYNEEEL